jgi:hypothetical protein
MVQSVFNMRVRREMLSSCMLPITRPYLMACLMIVVIASAIADSNRKYQASSLTLA